MTFIVIVLALVVEQFLTRLLNFEV